MITVKVNNQDLLNMLMDRVKYWTDDENTIELFKIRYEIALDCGCFDDEIDVKEFVDNDYHNGTLVLDRDELIEYGWVDSDRIIAEYNGYYLVYAC